MRKSQIPVTAFQLSPLVPTPPGLGSHRHGNQRAAEVGNRVDPHAQIINLQLGELELVSAQDQLNRILSQVGEKTRVVLDGPLLQ